MAVANAMPVQLHLRCSATPPEGHEGQPTEFGLQDKKQVLHPGLPEPDGSLLFVCEAALKQAAKATQPDFAGPFVHGPAGAHFLYLGWRKPGEPWIRRWKIPLPGITPAQIDQLARMPSPVFEAGIRALDKATLVPVGGGWTYPVFNGVQVSRDCRLVTSEQSMTLS